MNKKILLFLLMLIPLMASADDSGKCGSHLIYSYVDATKTLTISGTGPMVDYGSSPAPWYWYKSSIKYAIIESGVTSIGWEAFRDCSGLTSITIPNSVTSIGSGAFEGCSGLTSITIPNSVTYIGGYAFRDCSGLTSVTIPNSVTYIGSEAFDGCSGLTSIAIPNSVTSIGSGAFQNCSGLTSITIPNSVTYIGGSAFSHCSGLTSVTIPNSVTYIGSEAFEYCSGLTSVTIPNSVTSIKSEAFYGCSGLTSVTIPNSVTSIGSWAFYNCSGLTSITIPNSVTSIEYGAFQNCSGLTTIVSEIENPFAIDDDVFPTSVYNSASLLVSSGKKSAYQNTAGWKRFQNIVEASAGGKEFEANGIRYLIGENNTVSVTSKTEKYAGAVSIPSQVYYDGNNYTVTSIAQSAFEGCVDMTAVAIPSTVTTIGGAAFYYCTGLTTVDIPNGVKTIGEGAFSKCGGLTSVTIPSSVTSIGKNAFFQCYGLTQITSWIENPFAIDDGVFPSSVYTNASLLVPSGRKSAYQNTAGWKRFQNIAEASVVVKEFEANGVRYLIGENNTVSVISKTEKYAGAVSIPNQVSFNGNNYTVTSIASSAFEGCTGLTSVTIPSSVTIIGGAAFYMCTGLTTVDIPNGVKTIGEGAFSKCEGLTSVTIPGSVTSIGKNAFFQCYGLTQITSWIENPFAIDDGVFPTSVYNNASLLVPSGKKSAYQNTAGWKRFQNITEASAVGKEFEANGVRYLIGENNTVSVISKTEKYAGAVSIPNQVTFNDNNYTVTSISSSAFEGCTGMTSISISGSVTTIGDAAFYYCTSLTTVDIPNGVKTIGEGAFSKCEGLTSVTIPGSVTSIGKNAFFQCYALTQITSWIENPFAIDDGVFPTSVYNNASLLVPSGKKSAYQNTAGWKRFQNIYYVDGVYTLTYYVDGVEYKSVTYSSGAGITPEAEPTKEGYTFSGWIDIPETMPDHDVTVTGTFTINQYTITYVIDGEVYATVTVDFNSKIVPLTPPSKDGFDFAWEDYPETMPAHDITINGAYTTTGILSIAVESGKAKIFTLDGRQVDTLQKGINIIRMDDGTIKKVVLGK